MKFQYQYQLKNGNNRARFWPIWAILLLSMLACRNSQPPATPKPQPTPTAIPSADTLTTQTLEIDGRSRSWLFYRPLQLSGDSAPLVLVYHGGLANAQHALEMSDFTELADEFGFMVAFPEGVGRTWNSGSCCGKAVSAEIDDISFTRALVAQISAANPVDPARIYATGISNGGMFAYRLACDAPDLIAAIAPVAAILNVRDDQCSPEQSLAILHIHGSGDQHVPFAGGTGSRTVSGLSYRSVPSSIDFFTAAYGCDAAPETTQLNQRITQDNYQNCASDGEIQLLTIDGGGHRWPLDPAWHGLDPATTSATIWQFFANHSR